MFFTDQQQSPDPSDSGLSQSQGPSGFKKHTFTISNVFNPQVKRAIINVLLAEDAGTELCKEDCTIRVLISSNAPNANQGLKDLAAIPGIDSVHHLVDGIYSASFDVRHYKDVEQASCIQYVEGKALKKPTS